MPANEPYPESSAERHFIEMATRPLEDQPGIRDEARGELMERLSRIDPAEREAVAEAAMARLAKSEPGRWTPKAIALVLAWLVMAGVCGHWGYSFYRQGDDFANRWQSATDPSHRMAEGSLSNVPAAEFTTAADYEASLGSGTVQFPSLPANYREVWMKLDEGNGAWSWREALHLAREVFSKSASTTPADLAMARKRLEEAARAPRFEIYTPERQAGRLAAVAPVRDALELTIRADGGVYRWLGSLDSRREILKELLRLNAQPLVDAKDQEGLRAAIRDWETLSVRLAAEALTADDLGTAADLIAAGEALQSAATDLGMSAEAERLDQQIDTMDHDDPKSFPTTPDPAASMMARTIYYPRAGLPDLDFKPGRMLEYTLIERVLALAAVVPVLLALAMVLIETVKRSPRVNGLASGLGPIFDGRDGLWLIGLGVLAPFAWYWTITRLTPLGGRDFAFADADYPPVVLQALGGLLLLLVMIVQTGQWRIARRGAGIGLGPRMLWPGWLAGGAAAVVVPLAGIGRFLSRSDQEQFLMMTLATASIPLLWLLWRGGALFFGPGSNALGGVLLARATTLPLALSAAALLIAYPLLLSQEKDWLAQDRVTGWDRAHGTTCLEARSVDAYIAKCRELFSPPK